MIYFALGNTGRVYNLCDCGDFEAAEESALDVMEDGEDAVWIADEQTARQWLDILTRSLTVPRL